MSDFIPKPPDVIMGQEKRVDVRGGGLYLEKEFGLSEHDAIEVLIYWMKSFSYPTFNIKEARVSDQMIKDAELGRLVRLLPRGWFLLRMDEGDEFEWEVDKWEPEGNQYTGSSPDEVLRFIQELEKDGKTIEETSTGALEGP